MPFHEQAPRSLIKTLTYRILIILSNGLLVYIVTEDPRLTGEITLGAAIISTTLYYLHERLWNRIQWGIIHVKK